MRRVSGFSLIELMVVVSVIAILTLIALPSYQSYVKNAYKSKALANARVCLGEKAHSGVDNSSYNPPEGCTLSEDGSSCTCTVSGLVGSVTCSLGEGGSVSCE